MKLNTVKTLQKNSSRRFELLIRKSTMKDKIHFHVNFSFYTKTKIDIVINYTYKNNTNGIVLLHSGIDNFSKHKDFKAFNCMVLGKINITCVQLK